MLTDVKIEDTASLHKVLDILHHKYQVPHVVISSIPLRQWLRGILPPNDHPIPTEEDAEDQLLCMTSSRVPGQDIESSVHSACVPLIPGYFSGVGDLFSALILGHYDTSLSGAEPLVQAVELALTKTHAMLQRTYEYAESLAEVDRQLTDDELDAQYPERRVRRMSGRELRLVQGQDILRGGAEMGPLRQLSPWVGFWDGYTRE